MKKIIALFLCLVLVVSCVPVVFAKEPVLQTVRTVNDVAALPEGADPVKILKGTLYVNGNPEDVYAVITEGMDFTSVDLSEPRSMANAVKISLSNENNAYVNAVCEAVLEYVPKGSNLIFWGRSMGGMVLQQVIAQPCIKDSYNVLYSLAVAAPFIFTKGEKEGQLRRVVDRTDIVPFLSIAGLANPYVGDVSMENSGMVLLVHFYGYKLGRCWKSYDCLGKKGGDACFECTEVICE